MTEPEFAKPAGALVPIERHADVVRELIGAPVVASLPLAGCLGLVLAGEVRTPIALPPFDNSAMDGYAVRAADVVGARADAPVTLPVVDDIPAGRIDVPALRDGSAHRIMTGAPMPAGADAVVQVELTDAGRDVVEISDAVEPGTHVRHAGDDVRAGDVVLAAGVELTASRLGLAAATGHAELAVYRQPTALVLSTGSELVAPGQPLAHGQIYESNAVMLAAAVRAAGGRAEVLRFVPDDVESLYTAIHPRLSTVDFLLTTGGVSAGAYEVVKDALADAGVHFYKVAMQPGGPQGAGRYAANGALVPVIALPGNPVSALVSFEVFVRPAIRAALGHRVVQRERVTGRLTTGLRSIPGRRQYRRANYHGDTGELELVGEPGSHLLSALAASNCLLEIPEQVHELAAGDEVTALLLD